MEIPVRTILINGVPKQIFSTRETAKYLTISYSYLMKIRKMNENDGKTTCPPHILIGKRKWYVKEDVDKWLHQLPKVYRSQPRTKKTPVQAPAEAEGK